MLVWTGRHPVHGYSGWTLYYLDDPVSDSPGVEDHFIVGDLTEVDVVVKDAQKWLTMVRE